MLEKANLDPSFTAHSILCAAFLKFAHAKTPIDTIIKAGSWSVKSTLRGFNDLPIAR